jgi:hypothetical protein
MEPVPILYVVLCAVAAVLVGTAIAVLITRAERRAYRRKFEEAMRGK